MSALAVEQGPETYDPQYGILAAGGADCRAVDLVGARGPEAARRRHHQPEFQGRGRRPPLRRARRPRSLGSWRRALNRACRKPRRASGGLEPGRGARGARHSRPRLHRGPHLHRRGRTQARQSRASDRHGPALPPRRSTTSCAGPPRCSGCSMSSATTGTRLREGKSRHLSMLPDLLARADRLEAAVGPIEVVFGHNDLLAANFIDDGKRLWLLDWEYAGFNSPLFDLGGLASNSELSREQAEQALALYFGRPVDDRIAPPRRGHDRSLALARDHVEHGVGNPLDRRFRLRGLHGGKPAALRGRLRRLRRHGERMSELPVLGEDRHHRRRHRRLFRGLPSRQDGPHRHAPARTRQADLRLDLARRRACRTVAHERQHHPAPRLLRRALREARAGDRARDGMEAQWRLAACLQSGALDRGEAAGDHRHLLRARHASPDPEGSARFVAA